MQVAGLFRTLTVVLPAVRAPRDRRAAIVHPDRISKNWVRCYRPLRRLR
jgi:hypothetical protein